MHINDGELRAFIDKELTDEGHQKVVRHLDECPQCRQRLTTFQENAELAEAVIHSQIVSDSVLEGTRYSAYRNLRHQIKHKEKMPMWRKLINSKQRPVYIGLAVVLLMTIAFSFPQVRAVANSFLGLFRVQQVTIVQSALSLNEVPDHMDQQFMLMEDFLEEKIEIEIDGKAITVETEAEAEALVDFDVRLPDTGLVSGIEYQPPVQATIQIERELWQVMVEQMGYEMELPEELDGAEVVVSIPASVTVYVGECDYQGEDELTGEANNYRCSTFTQMPSPTVEAPEGLDLNQLGTLYLQMAGVSQEDAEEISKNIEWANTLVIPVPRDAEANEVQVDGVTGYEFEDGPDGRYYSTIWLKDDMVYVLSGNTRSHQWSILSGLQ